MSASSAVIIAITVVLVATLALAALEVSAEVSCADAVDLGGSLQDSLHDAEVAALRERYGAPPGVARAPRRAGPGGWVDMSPEFEGSSASAVIGSVERSA